MSLGLPTLSRNENPIAFHSNTATTAHLISEKGSSALKSIRYTFEWIGNLSHLSSDQLATLSSSEKALSSGKAIETLLSGEKTLENTVESVTNVIEHTYKWQKSEVSSSTLSTVLVSALAEGIQKVDSFLKACEVFNLQDKVSNASVHGLGYVITAVIAIKDYLNGKNLEGSSPNHTKVKKAAFALNLTVTLIGLSTLLFTSIHLTVTSLTIATLAMGANLTDYFLTAKNDPNRLEREALKKELAPHPKLTIRI